MNGGLFACCCFTCTELSENLTIIVLLLLCAQGVPLPVIFAMFKEALSDCVKFLDALLIKVPRKVIFGEGLKAPSERQRDVKLSKGGEILKKRSKVLSFSRHFSCAGVEKGVSCHGAEDVKPNEKPVFGHSRDLLRSIRFVNTVEPPERSDILNEGHFPCL